MAIYREKDFGSTLCHFNPNHDPRNGQFSKSSNSLSRRQKKRVIKKLQREQVEHFRSQISDEANKVTKLSSSGYDVRGMEWTSAYRKGLVTSKDDDEIKRAARETRKYMMNKYGKELIHVLAAQGVIGEGQKAIDNYLKKHGEERFIDILEPNLSISNSDSAVTKKVKSDYNSMNDREFRQKYQTSKETYAKRVEKYGDPYMNSPLAKIGKRLKNNV